MHTSSLMLVTLALAAFSILILIVSMLYPSRRDQVEFDADGLHDPRLGLGKIYWKEVRDFYIADGAGNRFLCLGVQRPERFLIQADHSMRARLQYHQSLGFKRINVDVRHINMSVEELHRRIERRIEAAQSSPRPVFSLTSQ